MTTPHPDRAFVAPPDPGRAGTLDELVESLRSLKVWSGDPSYETIKNRINAAWSEAGRPAGELARRGTVVDCFRSGRRRMNSDLLVAVVQALHPDAGYVAQWRQALRVVLGEIQAATQVRAQDQLPPDLAGFTGRRAELDRLRQLLSGGAASGGAVVITAIEGMAGVGKTQLAIHAGHMLAREQPFDQVLFVNLRGFHPDPAQPPADPAGVLDSFLRLLGVPGQQIPPDVDARTVMYRRQLAGKRALVVLDNANSEDQVRPLLADNQGCLTLVTSRHRLSALPQATHTRVGVFTPGEALDFLRRAASGTPVGGDPWALDRLVERCGRLPLALSLVAGHIRTKPGWTLTDHADRLDDRYGQQRLDSGVELALDLSYRNLPADRQRLLRLLGLHPGPDIDVHAAAALAAVAPATSRELLRDLVDDHLVQTTAAGRFGLHDLVRVHAASRSGDEDRPSDRRAALARLFDHYLHTAAAATDTLGLAERHHRLRIPPSATPATRVADPAGARGWLDIERANLIATAAHAASHGWPQYTTCLAAVLNRHLVTAGHYADAIVLHTDARQAAHHSGDRDAEARALTYLGTANWWLGGYRLAFGHYRRALTLFRQTGDRYGEGRALTNLASVLGELGNYRQAIEYNRKALTVFRETGDRRSEAHVLTGLGHDRYRLGSYQQAADYHRQALALHREIGDRRDEAHVLTKLGLVYERLGSYEQADDHHQRALAVFRGMGDRSSQAHALTNIGAVHERLGRHQQAVDHHRQALALFRQIGNCGGEIQALNNLAETLSAGGRHAEAATQHAAALALADQAGDRYEQARSHRGLARTHEATGDAEQAGRHWQQALAIYAELGVPEADQVRAHLTAVSTSTSTEPAR